MNEPIAARRPPDPQRRRPGRDLLADLGGCGHPVGPVQREPNHRAVPDRTVIDDGEESPQERDDTLGVAGRTACDDEGRLGNRPAPTALHRGRYGMNDPPPSVSSASCPWHTTDG